MSGAAIRFEKDGHSREGDLFHVMPGLERRGLARPLTFNSERPSPTKNVTSPEGRSHALRNMHLLMGAYRSWPATS